MIMTKASTSQKMSIDKYLLTEDFKDKFAEFCKLETDAEKEDFFARCGKEYKQKTPEEQSFMDKKAWDGVLAIGDRIAEMVQEAQQLVAPKRRIA